MCMWPNAILSTRAHRSSGAFLHLFGNFAALLALSGRSCARLSAVVREYLVDDTLLNLRLCAHALHVGPDQVIQRLIVLKQPP